MKPFMTFMTFSVCLMPLLAGASASRADLLLTLSPGPATIASGGVVTFRGTITNTGTETVDLLSWGSPSFSGPGSMDSPPFDTPGTGYTDLFFNGTPYQIVAGSNSDAIDLFRVTADNTSVAGDLLAGSFTVTSYGESSQASIVSDPANFAVRVSGASAVPKASTTVSLSLLLALGMGGLVIAVRRKKAVAS